MMDINTYVGIAGLLLILLAFALNLSHKLTVKSKSYNLMNLIGSAFLAYYSWFLGSIPFLILQIVWFLLSLSKLIHVGLKQR